MHIEGGSANHAPSLNKFANGSPAKWLAEVYMSSKQRGFIYHSTTGKTHWKYSLLFTAAKHNFCPLGFPHQVVQGHDVHACL